MKLSVSIVGCNVEQIIARTLEPLLPLADEIIFIDSFSSDNTCSVVAGMGAKLFEEPWAGYVEQKNSALSKCSGEWVLSVDSDEVITPELAEEIRKVINSPEAADGYFINRRTHYMGRLLKYAWQPDRRLRLVRRSASPRWQGENPHDELVVQGKSARLPGYLVHYSYTDFADHMRRTSAHAQVIAKTQFERGRRCGGLSIMCKPPLMFLKRMFLQGAFLDGVPGIMAAISSGVYAYMKFSHLWELQAREREAGKNSVGN